MKFIIEQVALCPHNTPAARELLEAMGLTEWAEDAVSAVGDVYGKLGRNVAQLAFNYQASPAKTLELEVLRYVAGPNWVDDMPPCVSHLGMHVTHRELEDWRAFFFERGIAVAQEVNTTRHTNPVIAGKRSYTYVIFETRAILGVDVKFIVRHNYEPSVP